MAEKLMATFVLLMLSFFQPVAAGQPLPPHTQQAAGIWQLIEERGGRTACYGAVIQVARLTFPVILEASAIEVIEGKHNQSVKELMRWDVDPTRKRLTIRFRPGMGDFGTGNRVEIRIKHDVLEPTSVGTLIWVLETDPL